MAKERIDQLLVNRNFFASRERAKAAIMSGLVFINEEKIDKPGTKVDVAANIRVKGDLHPFVSRGGLKLLKAIQLFDLSMQDRIMMDIGASTGGFTDCALQYGVSKVYAIDVGYGQLAWSLRNDPRVIVMERTNFRHLTTDDLIGPLPDLATIDVSFISLRLILPNLCNFLPVGGEVIALVKPQFEAGKEQVGKNGVVRDPKIHELVLQQILDFVKELDFILRGITFSPIQGGEGNIEFLLYLQYKGDSQSAFNVNLKEFIVDTHQFFAKNN